MSSTCKTWEYFILRIPVEGGKISTNQKEMENMTTFFEDYK
jgi:hypothetical protein